jgi:hypothetical protein
LVPKINTTTTNTISQCQMLNEPIVNLQCRKSSILVGHHHPTGGVDQ